ncbi:2-hydroxyacid dehydrogenase [Jatrophihabitans sp.]|uniref:2-hydroxyacid dehydrogenase n=1 Tax=Jatrophihabitans sp. TaxID=1932789 RepID=UPI0030C6E00F
MITVCVPSEQDVEALEVPAELLVWDGTGPPPDGIEQVEFLLAPYMGATFATESLTAMPALKVVQLLSAGVEPWLAKVPPGVTLCNGRGVHGSSTAELAVAGLLSLVRGLPRYARQQAEGQWQERRGGDLDGARVLLLGAGDINQRVAGALRALGADCVFVARTARDGVHGVDELPGLLPSARAVVLALPHTPETHQLVDAGFLAALPDGAVLVNVARGTIVDTAALLAELRAGRLSAFLDVTDPEPLPADHPLWGLPNVVITPHVGGGTTGWRERGMRLVAEQIRRYVSGQPLVNVITGDY